MKIGQASRLTVDSYEARCPGYFDSLRFPGHIALCYKCINGKIVQVIRRDRAKKNILLTGLPWTGKTTLIKKLSEELSGLAPVGFYTEEIREGAVRKGFALVSLYGKRGLLSHIEINNPYRVGKYGVDVKGFENFLEGIAFLAPETGLIIIDEIGKMECLSPEFRRMIKEILSSEKMFIATIASKGGGLIEEIKRRDDVRLFEVTQENRDFLIGEILVYLKGLSGICVDNPPLEKGG